MPAWLGSVCNCRVHKTLSIDWVCPSVPDLAHEQLNRVLSQPWCLHKASIPSKLCRPRTGAKRWTATASGRACV